MPFTSDYLEDEYREPYDAFKKANSPEGNAAFLKTIHPIIGDAINAHVGQSNPLLVSQARRMALNAARNYDPKRSRLKTHLFNQLQGLKRVNRSQTQILKVPERVALDKYHLDNFNQELIDKLAREPTDEELANHSGMSLKRIAKVRSYNPAVAEGTLEAATPTQEVLGGVRDPRKERMSMWQQIVYDDLSPTDKMIMEHTLGMNGRKPMANQDIAKKLNRSPGLISQRKKFIQSMLDREDAMMDAGLLG